MTTETVRKSHPLAFFGLVFAMSVPFWIISVGLDQSNLPDHIPITDIGATLTPLVAACGLVFLENGWSGLRRFLARIFDLDRVKDRRWLIAAVLLPPSLYVLTYGAMRIARFPVQQNLNLSAALFGAFVMFAVAAAVEEVGYSAYATDALQSKFSAISTALIVGVPWAVWHLPSMIKMGQSSQLMVRGLLATVAFRVITLWIYNNSNFSLSAVVITHAVGTTARTAYPGGREGYELGDGAISYSIIILTAITVIGLWGWRTLSSYRGPAN